MEEAYDVVRC